MRSALVARLRRYGVVVVRGNPSRRLTWFARGTFLFAVFAGLLSLVALVVIDAWAGLAVLELAVLSLVVGILGLPASKGKKKGSKKKDVGADGVDAEALARLDRLPGVLATFRELAAANPLPSGALPPLLAPLHSEPKVSIIIPALNEQAHLEQALRSALAQTWPRLEIIVVDDGSRDNTAGIASRLAAADQRVKFVRHAVPHGLSAARNAGISRSTGELLVFLDGDDVLHPEAIAQRVDALLGADLRITVASTGAIRLVPSDWKPHWDSADTRGVGLPVSLWTVGIRSPFGVHQVLLRRDVIDLVGGFDESRKHGAEDLDLWLRLLRRGYSFVGAPLVDCVYRQREGSMIEDLRPQHLKSALEIVRVDEDVDDDPALIGIGDAAIDVVAGERIARWSMSALLAGQPQEALDTLRLMSPSEMLAVRSAVDLRGVAMACMVRDELRQGVDGVKKLPPWREASVRLRQAVVDVAFSTGRQDVLQERGAA